MCRQRLQKIIQDEHSKRRKANEEEQQKEAPLLLDSDLEALAAPALPSAPSSLLGATSGMRTTPKMSTGGVTGALLDFD